MSGRTLWTRENSSAPRPARPVRGRWPPGSHKRAGATRAGGSFLLHRASGRAREALAHSARRSPLAGAPLAIPACQGQAAPCRPSPASTTVAPTLTPTDARGQHPCRIHHLERSPAHVWPRSGVIDVSGSPRTRSTRRGSSSAGTDTSSCTPALPQSRSPHVRRGMRATPAGLSSLMTMARPSEFAGCPDQSSARRRFAPLSASIIRFTRRRKSSRCRSGPPGH
jgi:hypothetical protein